MTHIPTTDPIVPRKPSVAREGVRRMAETIRDAMYAFDPRTWRSKWPKFEPLQAREAVQFFDEHGWVIFRNVFDAAEIHEFRAAVESIRQTGYAGDLLSSKDLGGSRFILEGRIVGIVKTVLRGAPCYFGDSSASIDVGAMGFHKDNPDREDARAPDWRSPYTLIRIGVYLQDHAAHSGGLAVRDRSHLEVNRNKGRPLAIPTKQGDLVLWSLRTTHSGYAARLKTFPWVFVPMPLVKVLGSSRLAGASVLPRFFRPLEMDSRLAIFATYGINDEHQARYLAYLRTRQYAVSKWRATVYDDSIFDAAEARGVRLISMHEQVQNIEASKLHKEHVELPW